MDIQDKLIIKYLTQGREKEIELNNNLEGEILFNFNEHEELGLLVGILLIIGYMVMLWRILRIARQAENLRLSILAYGVFLYLLFHILINLLGILALIPLTGVPLPFLHETRKNTAKAESATLPFARQAREALKFLFYA